MRYSGAASGSLRVGGDAGGRAEPAGFSPDRSYLTVLLATFETELVWPALL